MLHVLTNKTLFENSLVLNNSRDTLEQQRLFSITSLLIIQQCVKENIPLDVSKFSVPSGCNITAYCWLQYTLVILQMRHIVIDRVGFILDHFFTR